MQGEPKQQSDSHCSSTCFTVITSTLSLPRNREHFALFPSSLRTCCSQLSISMQGLYPYFFMEQFTTSESFLHLEKTRAAHCCLAGNVELSLLPSSAIPFVKKDLGQLFQFPVLFSRSQTPKFPPHPPFFKGKPVRILSTEGITNRNHCLNDKGLHLHITLRGSRGELAEQNKLF